MLLFCQYKGMHHNFLLCETFCKELCTYVYAIFSHYANLVTVMNYVCFMAVVYRNYFLTLYFSTLVS